MTGGALIAALPMYDGPGTAQANDAIWAAIAVRLRERGVAAPERLTRGGDLASLWRSPNLVFGQTCGYPYVKDLRGAVALIATPEYDFPGCEGVAHRSFLVRRAGDPRRSLEAFRGAVAALNAWDSNSGMNLFRAAIAPLADRRTFFGAAVTTGSHRASLEAVADGRADLAAIDCVSFALMRRFEAGLVAKRRSRQPRARCRRDCPSSPAPACPRRPSPHVREALFAALADPELAQARASLGLIGARPTTPADYGRILDIEREAEAAGYPRLA